MVSKTSRSRHRSSSPRRLVSDRTVCGREIVFDGVDGDARRCFRQRDGEPGLRAVRGARRINVEHGRLTVSICGRVDQRQRATINTMHITLFVCHLEYVTFWFVMIIGVYDLVCRREAGGRGGALAPRRRTPPGGRINSIVSGLPL